MSLLALIIYLCLMRYKQCKKCRYETCIQGSDKFRTQFIEIKNTGSKEGGFLKG